MRNAVLRKVRRYCGIVDVQWSWRMHAANREASPARRCAGDTGIECDGCKLDVMGEALGTLKREKKLQSGSRRIHLS